MSQISTPYEDLLREILQNGAEKSDRTCTGTLSLFGKQMRYDISKSFPLITTKKVHFKSIAIELLWFLKGQTNISFLQENGVSIWNEWADKNGELGPVYGAQWRHWKGSDGKTIDQISRLIDAIKKDPSSRRLVVSAWNVAELSKMALEPCHILFQVYVAGNKLSLQIYQRSCDMFLGVPFNIASYALLAYMIADQCNLIPAELIWVGGDCHIYLNHIQQVKTQIKREPFEYPRLKINRRAKDIFDYKYEDFELVDYKCHGALKGDVAV